MSNPATTTKSSSSSSPPSPLLPSSHSPSTMALLSQSQSHESSISRRVKPTTTLETSPLPPINQNNTNTSVSVPNSAVSSCSLNSSLPQSPIMSPQLNQLITTNSSIQASPEGPRGRDGDPMPTPFELPESIVSRKPSQNAMGEAMSISKSTGLIRRLSNKASKFAPGRRRQSSNQAMSREQSSGPVIMRRRSDSTSTAPDAVRPYMVATDSDDELTDITYEESIPDVVDGANSTVSTITPVSTNTNIPSEGPVIPFVLRQGTALIKITKKNKRKNLTFALDIDSAKVWWDKNKPSKSFFIDDIKEIRGGPDARNYREEFGISMADEARFFTIVYAIPDKSKGRTQKVMHLIAADEQICEFWMTTLDAISKHRHEFMSSLSSFNDKAIRSYWQREMSKKLGDIHSSDEQVIDFAGVERLCRSVHINISVDYLRAKFAAADCSRTGRLTFSEFQTFVGLMKQRPDIRSVYRGIATSNPDRGITLDEFIYFLTDCQREEVTEDNFGYWEGIFTKFVRRFRSKDHPHSDELVMNEQALTGFLTSTYNVLVHELPSKPPRLDRPLTEYFISSSHNTYLLGRQVAGHSSIEGYINTLLRGCRCVEVDCWNGPQGPVVMHGRTLTSQVSFKDVMSTIRKYAFVKTSFPLWVSLEVHCNAVQQAEMAQIIKDTLGEALVDEPLETHINTMPAPIDLLNRILIKVKEPHVAKKPTETELPSGRRRGNSLTNTITSPFLRPSQTDNLATPPQSPLGAPQHRLNRRLSNRQLRITAISEAPDSASSSTSDNDSIGEAKVGEDFPANRKKTSKIVPVLGALGVYSAGMKFRGFDSPEAKSFNHIYSFMEQTFAKHTKTPEDRRAVIAHNMKYMMRVYPNGWRVGSTNFDPLNYWRTGVQMAALNWQTYDLGMQFNDAMFASGSDQTGYVLKPAEFRGSATSKELEECGSSGVGKESHRHISFRIDIISAQQLMRPKNLPANQSFDPFIEVEIHHADDRTKDSKGVIGEGGENVSSRDGPSGLGNPHRRRTHPIVDNGFNPQYDSKFLFSLTTKYPELVFIRFAVRHSPAGSPLASYMVKLKNIKQGYRTIPLMDTNGDQFLFSTLFCQIHIDEPKTLYLQNSEAPSSVGVLKSLGRKLTGNQTSPKNSMESN